MRKVGKILFGRRAYLIHLSYNNKLKEIRYSCFSKITIEVLNELFLKYKFIIVFEKARPGRKAGYVFKLKGGIYLFRELIDTLTDFYQVNWLN